MMPDERDCRVLVVDNKIEYAARVAASLQEIRPSLINNNDLKIELANTAYFVAERLRECPADSLPWDVIISDVFMPIPSDPFAKQVPVTEAIKTTFQFEGREWPYWEYRYSWNGGSGMSEIAHGGLHIARTIKELKDSGKNLGNLKLVLISSRLYDENRKLLGSFTTSDRSWLEYHDKSLYEEPAAMNGWSTHNLPQDIFKWALIQTISKRDSQLWGDAIFDLVPNADDYLFVSRSPVMQQAVIVGRRLGGSRGVKSVVITGEVETGKEVIAGVVNAERSEALGRTLRFIKVDCSTIPAEQFESELFGIWDGRHAETSRLGLADAASGGTLYFKDLDQLPPHHQGKIVTLLKDRTFRRENGTENLRFDAELIIGSMTKDPAELVESNLFHPELYLHLKDNRIHLLPLRERSIDIVPLAERAITRSGEDVRLTPEAESWLRAQPWSGNVRDLMNTVASAAGQCSSTELTAKVLETSFGPTPRAQTSEEDEEESAPKAFQASSPFQLHWGESLLLDAAGHQIPLPADLHNVLKELLTTERGRRHDLKTRLTYEETATAYKGRDSFSNVDEAIKIAQAFARNLRRDLKKYGIHRNRLIVTWKDHGYQLGTAWANPPVIYHSEPSMLSFAKVESLKTKPARKGKAEPEY